MGMEDDDAGRGTTVPFLVAVRFVLAFAVGAVAFAVIVMVITMVSRPEEIQLSIDRGYITVLDEWEYATASSSIIDEREDVMIISSSKATFGNPVTVDPGPGSNDDYDYNTYENNNNTRDYLRLALSLTASYSSRRGHQDAIKCTDITVGLVDMTLSPLSWASGQLPANINESIVRFSVKNNFTVLKDTSHTEATTVIIKDQGQSDNVTDRLFEEDVFQVLVMVHMITSLPDSSSSSSSVSASAPAPAPALTLSPTPPPPSNNNGGSLHTFYCWPVTVGYGYRNLQATDDVDCKSIGSSKVPDRHKWPPPPPPPSPPSPASPSNSTN